MGKIKICQGRDDSGVDAERTGRKKKQSERFTGELGGRLFTEIFTEILGRQARKL